jgi:prepilin-type N-terminal cleavage/methylation domain-containing protein
MIRLNAYYPGRSLIIVLLEDEEEKLLNYNLKGVRKMKRNIIKSSRESRAGMSLIEVLVSMLILSIGVLAVIGVFPSAFKINANTWKTTRVMTIAQAVMDREQAKGVLAPTANPSPSPIPVDLLNGYEGSYNYNPSQPSRSYYSVVTERLADNGTPPSTSIQQIRVTVTWIVNMDATGRGMQVQHYSISSSVGP